MAISGSGIESDATFGLSLFGLILGDELFDRVEDHGELLVLRPGEGWPVKIGWVLVTAGALWLGAPFWFDLLGKPINLCAAGKKPETSKDKKEK